eukprot:2345168-Amphidinium_carterae.1
MPLDSRTVGELTWSRVRGDGNCFYRAMALHTKCGWKVMKDKVIQRVPQLRDSWRTCFPMLTDEMWQRDTEDLHVDKVYANEMCVAAAATVTGVPIVVLTESQAWAVCPDDSQPTAWKSVHILRHQGSGA